MKKLIFILTLQIGCFQIYGQEFAECEFVVHGIIGMQNVPIQNVTVLLNDQIEFTNELGKVSIIPNSPTLNIKIQHLGFSKVDTLYLTKNLKPVNEIIIVADCSVNSELAISDISKNEIKLLLAGGIAPKIVFGQEKIEERYNFNYYDFGCVRPPLECLKQYNYKIFEHLNEKYGQTWIKVIRKDLIGLEEYLEKSK